MATEKKKLRCAIYTRVSTDAGLEQNFNSLDAQREAAESYIKSQAHEGWCLVRETYDDGGFSGGTLDRPALQKLLRDLKERKVDVIVVYKVDRLTRSLADFAKLVELFDLHSASFVSVTQAFNTTTSMGRLTLNVLLSFAQFEREVTAERIRDKIAASKKKGIWMGGVPPLGYRVQDRKLVINSREAETVKTIFKRYLALGSTLPLLEELHRAGVKTRRRTLSSGKPIGGVPFTRGPLNHLLRNRTYIGELNHRGRSYPGEHPAILDKKIFDAVQTKLTQNVKVNCSERKSNDSILARKLFDDRGNLMTPTHTRKKGAIYRYYVCRLLVEGRRSEAGVLTSVPAPLVEQAVIAALRSHLISSGIERKYFGMPDAELLQILVDRVSILPEQLVITLNDRGERKRLDVPWKKPALRPKREILLPYIDTQKDTRPIKTEIRAAVVKAVAQGRMWLAELTNNPNLTVEDLAKREDRSARSVHMLLSLNFLAPNIIRALITGKLPRGIGITRLVNLPPDWDKQYQILGLVQPE